MAACAALAACSGAEGTIDLGIVTAPGSDVMDRVEVARLTLSNPPAVVEAERNPDGTFDLALDVAAEGQRGRITLEGFDGAGDRIAVGHAGPLPIASIDVAIEIYVAPPRSLAEAPVALDPPRTDIGAAPLVFGAVLAGGRTTAGPTADVTIYNAHAHEFQVGDPLPGPRAGAAVTAGQVSGLVHIFGGTGGGGGATATGWTFDTGVPPAGLYRQLEVEPGLARTGADAAPLAGGAILVTGDPPVRLDTVQATARPISGAPPLAGTATAGGAGVVLVAGAGVGDTGAARAADGTIEELDAPAAIARTGHGAAALPGGDVIVLGGEAGGEALRSAVRYAPDGDRFTVIADVLATPRTGAAVAVARGRLLVAGGTDPGGAIVPDAEVFDAATLEPLATIPMVVPRADPVAVPLENGQILVAGGTGANGAPVGVLELFTPDV